MDSEEVLKRYYRGETGTGEEKALKELHRKGGLKQEPVLGYRGLAAPEEVDFDAVLTRHIKADRKRGRLALRLAAGSVAAAVILFLGWGLVRQEAPRLQLSDNLKRERLEDALKTVGQVLEDRDTPRAPRQKILYEDHRLIIAIE